MAISEILDIVGYVVAYLAVGLGLSPLAVRVARLMSLPDEPPDPTEIGAFILIWPIVLGTTAIIGLVTGLGRLACWLSGVKGERSSVLRPGLRWIAEGEWKCSCGRSACVKYNELPSDEYARYVAMKEREHAGCRVVMKED
jgi:hypothetical protein